MAEAQTRTGLADFGHPAFRDGLERLLDAIDHEIQLTDAQSDGLHAQAVERLVNRLEIEDHWRRHPELAEQVIAGPISITGLPRTGTTALCNMLSLDDQFRCLRMWEQPRSCPPPIAETEHDDPRRQAATRFIEQLAATRPDLMAMHLWDTDVTEEDIELLGTDFHAQQLGLPIFGYHRWWRDADLRPTFAFHRRVLQLLQSRRPPNRWLLKAPSHNFHLEAIAEAYPDARFVITHRDPGKAVPSAISLIAALMPPGSIGEEALARFGTHHAEHLRIGAERSLAARARIGEERFLDIHHRDFVRDSFGTLATVYDFLGLELRADVRTRMETWHAANRTGKHGGHHYTAEQFGLSEEGIRADFDFYIRRFGIQIEG